MIIRPSLLCLHLNFHGRIVIEYANSNHVNIDPILCRFCSMDEGM
jgi:hypothetical protein